MKMTLLIIVVTLGFTSPSWALDPPPAASGITPGAATADDKAIRPFHFTAFKSLR